MLHGRIGERVLRLASSALPSPDFSGLTAREVQVLEMVARGLPNHEIASQLFISVKTVQNRVSDLLTKTGCATRAELVARARDCGVGSA